MNKKMVLTIILVVAVVLVIAPLASAKKGGVKPLKCNTPASGKAGKSNVAHLYLYPDVLAAGLAKGQPWAKMKYNLSGSALNLLLNGKSLTPETDYTLITYVEGTMDIQVPVEDLQNPGQPIVCTTIDPCTAANPQATCTIPDGETEGVCTVTVTVESITFTCLGSDTANGGGNVHFKSSLPEVGDMTDAPLLLVETGLLPAGACDGNEIPAPEGEDALSLLPPGILEGCGPIDFDDTDVPPPI